MKFLGAGSYSPKKLKKYFSIRLVRNCFILKQLFLKRALTDLIYG